MLARYRIVAFFVDLPPGTVHFPLALDVTGCYSALRKMCTHVRVRVRVREPRMSDGYRYRFRAASSRVLFSPCIRQERERESVGVGPAFEIADDVCAYNKYRDNTCNQIAGRASRGFFFFFAHVESGYQHG